MDSTKRSANVPNFFPFGMLTPLMYDTFIRSSPNKSYENSYLPS